jgi:hypothetical protein
LDRRILSTRHTQAELWFTAFGRVMAVESILKMGLPSGLSGFIIEFDSQLRAWRACPPFFSLLSQRTASKLAG